jgi:hypothetical protein
MDVKDIYISFRKAQSEALGRPYRLPKDFEYYFQTKLSPKNREALETAVQMFSTKWRNIDIDRYFTYGFELFGKNFTYVRMFDRRLFNLYVDRDKNEKRDIEGGKRKVIDSAKFIKEHLKTLPNYKQISDPLRKYCNLNDGLSKVAVNHYLTGKIDKLFLVWLIRRGFLPLTDQDRALIPYIVENYRMYSEMVEKLTPVFVRIGAAFGVRDGKKN